MLMASTTVSPNCIRNAILPFPKCSGAAAFGFVAFAPGTTCAFGSKHYSQHGLFAVSWPSLANNFKKMAWFIRSNLDSSTLDPSPDDSNGTTRLIRAIQALQTRLGARIQELRRGLPLKLLFFLAGFYCATAFATVIGQTGDWDILSAALAVVVVEGIGALMYRASFVNKFRNIVTIFNYWKTGLSLGLFLDSFKYEMDDVFGFTNPLSFELDVFSIFV